MESCYRRRLAVRTGQRCPVPSQKALSHIPMHSFSIVLRTCYIVGAAKIHKTVSEINKTVIILKIIEILKI